MSDRGPSPGHLAPLRFERLRPVDLLEIEPRERQKFQCGVPVGDMTFDEAEAHSRGDAWTAWDGERIAACFGISELFEGVHGLAWALLADGIGSRHLQLTRFVRDEVVGRSPLRRIEAIVRCNPVGGEATPEGRIAAALRDPTPELRWMMALGFEPACVLREYGAMSETHMLMERIG